MVVLHGDDFDFGIGSYERCVMCLIYRVLSLAYAQTNVPYSEPRPLFPTFFTACR